MTTYVSCMNLHQDKQQLGVFELLTTNICIQQSFLPRDRGAKGENHSWRKAEGLLAGGFDTSDRDFVRVAEVFFSFGIWKKLILSIS